MIIHIPDKDFRMVRYYGFYNNKCHNILDEINKLIDKQINKYQSYLEKKKLLKRKLDKLKFRTQIADTYNRDVFKCGCGGIFKYTFSYNPLEGIKNDRKYREAVLMKCGKCGYKEMVPLSELETIKNLPLRCIQNTMSFLS